MAHIFWANCFHGKSYAPILMKMCWATFWSILSQTHLVTLAPSFSGSELKDFFSTFRYTHAYIHMYGVKQLFQRPD
jgi:hypothetical protein